MIRDVKLIHKKTLNKSLKMRLIFFLLFKNYQHGYKLQSLFKYNET